MIELVIFDLDGVLIDSRDLHFHALNKALEQVDKKYVISYDEHLARYDGLPTKDKLKILTATKELSPQYYEQIKVAKQQYTVAMLKETVKLDEKLIKIFAQLKRDLYKVVVASNAIRQTIDIILEGKGLTNYVDLILSNEDVKHPKPNPEIYLRAMVAEGVSPRQTLIVEDSFVGRSAVFNSGAHLYPVRNSEDLSLNGLYHHLSNSNSKRSFDKWPGDQMNILIPMAGAGSRFATAGYTFPKPLIEVRGKPMIQVVVENLNVIGNYTYVVRSEHYEKYNLKYLLNMITPGCNIVQVNSLTEGAACTTLLAKQFINNDNPLLIANSDQYIEWESGEFYHSMNSTDVDGGILTFENTHPKWSYVKTNEYGHITQVAEKQVISNVATVGIYYWSQGSRYVRHAEDMIARNLRVNNEFYVAPTYNLAIEQGAKIRPYNIKKMWGIGTPEDLNYFLQNYKDTI